jgi:DNA-binding transcriptional LysR family regulator
VNDDAHVDNVPAPWRAVQFRKGIAPIERRVVSWRDVSLIQIESFVAVAEEGHVGRAARRLYLTQPPLTRRIRSLEDELGSMLFERTARGMRLSAAGRQLLPHAREILASVARAKSCLRTSDPEDSHP